MAYVNAVSAGSEGLFGRLALMWSNYQANAGKRAVFRKTVSELNMLSDRELRDLGMHRSMIRRVAYQAAFEA